jgi:Arc/MetJ-type ribon-helix-helix transcriptional regulator
MATIHLTVPAHVPDLLDAEAAAGGFADPGELVAALVADHQERRAELAALLAEGRASGRGTKTIDDIIEEGRCRAAR